MTYRKFKADHLFTGEGMAEAGSVLITTDDGTVQAVLPAAAGDDVVYHPGLLCPGFINCHCHLELSHMKGVIPEGTGLVDFLSGVIRRRGEADGGSLRQGSLRQDEYYGVRAAIAAGEQEMLENGIVAVGDICNTADTLEQKRKGRLSYHNFIETMGFIEGGANMRFAHSLDVLGQFEEAWPGVNSIVPHAPYSVSPALFRMIAEHAGGRVIAGQAGGGVLTIHNQEDEEENVFFLSGKGDFIRLYAALGLDVSFFRGTGLRSMESWLAYFDKGQPMIVVHDVATREADLRAAEGFDLYFCLCPNANLYIGGRLPDVELLVSQGCRIVVGTDSLASNHGLSILEELKTLQRNFPGLPTSDMLRWATLNGAMALGMDGQLGSFAAGKKPGVVLLQGLEKGQLTAGTTVRRLL